MDDNLPYLFAAFAVAWAVLFLYSFFIARRQRDVEVQVRALQESVREGGWRDDERAP